MKVDETRPKQLNNHDGTNVCFSFANANPELSRHAHLGHYSINGQEAQTKADKQVLAGLLFTFLLHYKKKKKNHI